MKRRAAALAVLAACAPAGQATITAGKAQDVESLPGPESGAESSPGFRTGQGPTTGAVAPGTNGTAAPSTTVAVIPAQPEAPRVEPFAVWPATPEPSDAEWADREYVLGCIRSYEQGAAGYATETGNGHHGAYQFSPDTWDGAVTRAGHPEWAGRPASEAPGYVQDDAAFQLYQERGYQPWPTPQRLC